MCVVAVKYFKNAGWVGVKNRDRNYKPTIKFVSSMRGGIERLYLFDKKTSYTEGLNEFGVSIISASVMVKSDEKEGTKHLSRNEQIVSPDGKKIRTALLERNIKDVINKAIDLMLPGNTYVFNKDECYLLEATFDEAGEYAHRYVKLPKSKCSVRTNHGLLFPNAGYTKEGDLKSYNSTKARYDYAKAGVVNAKNPEEMLRALSYEKDKNPQNNPMRRSKTHGKSILVTTGQLMLIPSNLTLHYKPIWCAMELDNFDKINSAKTKCNYEIFSANNLLQVDENKLTTFKKYLNKIIIT